MVRRGLTLALSFFLALAAPRAARADESGKEEDYSAYEQETVDGILDILDAELEPEPEGKRISGVEVVVLEVIEERDPAPGFLNVFHATSKEYTVRRELLIDRGDRYDSKRIRESERNLRGLRQLSLVLILPLKTKDPDTVMLLVVAKDIWSLRLNSDYVIQEGKLLELFLQPSEENVAGTHRRLLGNFFYEPDTITFGGRFIDPRMVGSRVRWGLGANVIINHETGLIEGSSGSAEYGKPLFSTSTDWAWGSFVSWRKEVTRRFVGNQLDTYDAEITDGDDAIPFVYDTEVIGGRVSVTRSFGYAIKNDITVGAEATRNVHRPDDLSRFDPAAVGEFLAEVVPLTSTRNGPFIQHRFYLNRFTSLLGVETMGLQENFLLGPELFTRLRPIAKAFGSSRNLITWNATGAYTQQIGNGIMRGYVSGGAEHDLDRDNEITDAFAQVGLRMVSPSFYIGRMVYDGTFLFRPDNFSNSLSTLGGDGRLRGYPSQAFIGENVVASNLEFRTRAFQLWIVLVGGALFYDVGDAFDGLEPEIKQGAGFGFRVLFPQLGRSVMRFDWGFPIDPEPGSTVFDGLIITFRQAFGMPDPEATGVLSNP